MLVAFVAGDEEGPQSGIARVERGDDVLRLHDDPVGMIDPIIAPDALLDGFDGRPGYIAQDAQHDDENTDDASLEVVFHDARDCELRSSNPSGILEIDDDSANRSRTGHGVL